MSLREKQGLLFATLGLVGFAVFAVVAPRLYPVFGVRLDVPREEAIRRATEIAGRWVSDSENTSLSASLVVDREQLGYLQTTFGCSAANQLARDSIPAFAWKVKWAKASFWDQAYYASEEEALQAMASKLGGQLTVTLDTHGRLVGLSRREGKGNAEKSQSALDSLSAFRLARDFLSRVALVDSSRLVPVLAADVPRSVLGRGQHVFAWKDKQPVAGETVFHVVAVGRKNVVRYNRSYVPGSPFRVPKESSRESLPQLLWLLTLVIVVAVLAVRRLRADQMDLAMGIWPAVVIGIATLVSTYNAIRLSGSSSQFEILVGSVFATLFNVAAVIFLVAVTDSVARDVWPEKVTSATVLFKGKVLNRHVGRSVLYGFAWAGALLGAISLLDVVYRRVSGAVFLLGSPYALLSAEMPFVLTLSGTLALVVTSELAYRGFALSFLRRFVRRTGWLLVAGFVIGVLSGSSLMSVWIHPHGGEMLRAGLYGLLLAAVFLWHDLVTVFAAVFVQNVVFSGTVLMSAGLRTSGLELTGLLVALLLLGVLAVRRNVPEEELVELEPSYIHRLAERERIRRELEIARHVQQTFLPKETPRVRGLDVASRCVPAAEVGGDYYDLIKLSPARLGVVIGDVSGKGIGAAFYMTLTKGFLRAFARQSDSPKDVLVRVNELFYENAERTRFISMIYGIFDVEKGEFAFARAGHNPLLLRHTRSAEAEPMPVAPKGLALGLADTALFEKVTEESRMRIYPGDVFVLYTDGFTEAMDSAENEFGEARLGELLRTASNDLSASQILDLIYDEVQRFSGRGPQHDDMTLIVVRVLESGFGPGHGGS